MDRPNGLKNSLFDVDRGFTIADHDRYVWGDDWVEATDYYEGFIKWEQHTTLQTM